MPKQRKKKDDKKDGRKARKAVTNSEIIDALSRCGGYVSLAAESLGISLNSVDYRASRSPAVKKALDDCRRKRGEMYESLLDRYARAGSVKAVMFYLERLMPEKYAQKKPETQVNVQTTVGIQDFIDAARRRMEEEGR